MKRKELETSSHSDIHDGTDDTSRYSCKMINATTTITAHYIATVTTDVAMLPSLIFPIENMDILQLIVAFVGPKNYIFIAGVCQSFNMVYKQNFPNDTETNLNASTLEYAKSL